MLILSHLPFFDHASQPVGGEVHAVKVAEHATALNIFGDELEFTERPLGILIVLQVGERHFEDAALKTFGRDLCTQNIAI